MCSSWQILHKTVSFVPIRLLSTANKFGILGSVVEDMGENGEVELSDTDSKSNDSEEDDDQYIEGDVAKVDLEDQVAALFYILFL